MAAKFREKRRHPRVEKSLSLKLFDPSFRIITETKNISCSGAYCKVDRFLPPLTKLGIILFVPSITKNRDKHHKIECKGVVVRTEPAAEDNGHKFYNIAIFFEQIANNHSQIISNYVDWHLKGKKN